MTIVALYARVSSQLQAQKNTIESQIAELERRIAQDNHQLLDENKFQDNGFTGSNLEREGLKKLLSKVEEKKINKIYIHALDRLSRDGRDQRNIIDKCKSAGVEIISLDCKIEDTPSSNLLVDIKGAVARHELGVTSERCMRGKIHRASKGCVSVMGHRSFGYDLIKHLDREKTKIEINEEEAKVVKDLFKWIGLERISLHKAVQRLQDRCILSPTGKEVWSKSTISKILRNKAYKGKMEFGKTKVGPIKQEIRARWKIRQLNFSVYSTDEKDRIKIPVPRIVEDELFNIVQKQLDENRKKVRAQQSGRKHLLQGLLGCECCEYSYYAAKNAKKGTKYYRCTGTDARRFNGIKVCSSKSIRAEIIEMIIWEEIKRILKDPDKIAKEHKLRLLGQRNNESNDELNKERSRLEEIIKRLIRICAQGYMTEEECYKEVDKMREKLKVIEEQQKKMINKKDIERELDFSIGGVKAFASGIESELDQADWETKLSIILYLVRSIKINHDDMHIVFRFQELAMEMQEKNVQHCVVMQNSMYLASHV
ncbi:MAG: recombinase family protein [Wolbachia endosymbiont of Penenirmus auritus]|nr:recombinase family protein [Wolbachia endosymbiont of Penenirmus auritus]